MSEENVSPESEVEVSEEELVQESSDQESSAPSNEDLSDSEQQELAEEIQEAKANGETKEEIKERIERFHLKVNGKDYVRDINVNDKEAIKRELQKALAGQQAMQKASEMEKAQQKEQEELLKNPMKLFEKAQQMGIDPRELAYYYLQQQVQEAEKDPETKRQEEFQRKLEEAEKRREEAERKAQQMEFQALRQQEAAAIEEELLDIINNDDELEYTPKVIKEIINTYSMFYDMGHTDLNIKDVIPTVKYKLEKEFNSLFDSYASKGNYKMMEKLIGRKNFESWRQSQIDKVKDSPKPVSSKVTKTNKSIKAQESLKPKQKKRISQEEFLRNLKF